MTQHTHTNIKDAYLIQAKSNMGWLDLLSEKAMATHSSTLAWKIPWTGEPGRLQSMGLQRVGYDWATSLSLFTFLHWRRKWQPTPVLLPGESQGWGAWWAAVYGVAQSRTWLKRLSSSSSISSAVSMKSLEPEEGQCSQGKENSKSYSLSQKCK